MQIYYTIIIRYYLNIWICIKTILCILRSIMKKARQHINTARQVNNNNLAPMEGPHVEDG